LNRFLDGGFATEEGRSLRDDGDWTAPVAFWLGVRRLMGELLEGKPSPSRDYVMTEVVHCKSKDERGVAKAAGTCADEHLDAIFVACPAPVILVVGSRARDLIKPRLSLPPGFGTKATVGVDEVVNCVTRTVSGRERLVIYIWHPSGMTAPQRLAKAYPTLLPLIRRVAAGLEPVPSRSV
jgi:hypothetical protein